METATAPGKQTSEYKVTLFSSVLSVLAIVVGYASAVLDILPPSIKWVGPVTAIVGLIAQALTAIGYQVTRANVKAAALAASATPSTQDADKAAANLAKG